MFSLLVLPVGEFNTEISNGRGMFFVPISTLRKNNLYCSFTCNVLISPHITEKERITANVAFKFSTFARRKIKKCLNASKPTIPT